MRVPDPDVKISNHFTWQEAVYLPKWFRMATEHDDFTEDVCNNLIFIFLKLDLIRDFLDRPIIVHCGWRPMAYNKIVKGAINSAHLALEPNVAAVDFHVGGLDCDKAKVILLPKLVELEMRMENNGSHAPWIHLDTRHVTNGHSRFFNP